MRQVFNRLAQKGRKTVLGSVPAIMLAMSGVGLAHAQDVTATPPANDIPQRVLDIHENASQICAPITGAGGSPEIRARVDALTASLSRSETGASLVDFAKDGPAGPLWVCFVQDLANMGQYRSGHGVMDVPNAESRRAHLEGTSAHEIRHYWQEAVGFGVFENDNLSKKADSILALASEADADAIGALVMWELKQKGQAQGWDYHMDRSNCEAKICRDDILEAFEAAIKADAEALENGKALAAAFSQWYRDKKRRAPYMMAIMLKHTQRRMADVHGYASNETADPGYITGVESPISQTVRVGELDGMGELPHKGTNYLKQNGGYAAQVGFMGKRYLPYRPKS